MTVPTTLMRSRTAGDGSGRPLVGRLASSGAIPERPTRSRCTRPRSAPRAVAARTQAVIRAKAVSDSVNHAPGEGEGDCRLSGLVLGDEALTVADGLQVLDLVVASSS